LHLIMFHIYIIKYYKANEQAVKTAAIKIETDFYL
jgi:hypothetical protein